MAMRNLYRAVAGAVVLFCVAMQYGLVVADKGGAALLSTTVDFLSFFTILTNLLAGAALLVPVVAPRTAAGRFLARPSVRTAIAGYIILVGVVYHLLLREVSQAQGWQLLFERALHYVTPPLYVLDWLLFVPRGETRWTVGLASLGFPMAYIAWTLARGALTGWYPYPFVDVPALGYGRALANIAGLVAAYVALAAALVATDRLIRRVAS